MEDNIKIDKQERRKRLIEDFKKIYRNDVDAIKFAENLSDEILDKFEDMGFSSNRKIKIENNLELKILK